MNDFDGAIKEITASMAIFDSSPDAAVHNSALHRAIVIIRAYRDGRGIFQLGRRKMVAGDIGLEPPE